MHSKKFKYQEYLSKFSNCPPIEYCEKSQSVFRWVFVECDKNSFKPVLILEPARQLADDDKSCEGYALSMFEMQEGAYSKYKKLVRNKPQLKKNFGTIIAEINLSIEDGICSNPEVKNYSHFNLHEYEGTDLSKKVVNIIDIFDENGNFKK